MAFITFSLFVDFPALAASSPWQSVEAIERAALKHVDKEQADRDLRTESRVTALDRRLKLARCGEVLETFSPSAAGAGASRVIGVRCKGPKPWKIFVPVSTAVYQDVVVATRFLAKGETISKADVRLEERDVTRVVGGYLTDIKQLQGRILKRPVRNQSIIHKTELGHEDIIKRGQSVTLMARNSQLSVRMRGEALNAAGLNERIRVKNLTSKRTVEGTVVSRQLVLVDH
jgi:flagella basal body P-ring formation protein FlgA